jgi:hypothetical protein
MLLAISLEMEGVLATMLAMLLLTVPLVMEGVLATGLAMMLLPIPLVMEGVMASLLVQVLLPIPLRMKAVLATRLAILLLTVSLVQTAATVMDVARHVMVVYLPMHATLATMTLLMECVSIAKNSDRYLLLIKRKELALGILLVDVRRVPSDDDRAVLTALYDMGVPILVVATKIDKIGSKNMLEK